MLRIQLPERSTFRFGRKNYIPDEKVQLNALTEAKAGLGIPPHEALPLVHHTSTKSLFDLFQPQNELPYGIQTDRNEKATSNSLTVKNVPEVLQKPLLQIQPVSPFDALGSHRDPTIMASAPTSALVVVPPRAPGHDHSTASTPSSGFREDDDASACSRKSSTSSIWTPLVAHKASSAATEKDARINPEIELETKQSHPPGELDERTIRPAPQFDKPLPPPPSPERPFSASSVLSIMRAESFSGTAEQHPMEMVDDAPVVFRPQSQIRPSHGRSASDGILHSRRSTTFKVKSPTTSPKSKRGARLGTAMREGHSHARAQTLGSIPVLPLGFLRLEKPRPLSMPFDNVKTKKVSHEELATIVPMAEEPAIAPSAAEGVVFEIMRRLDEPADLLAVAAVSRGFYGAFKRGEPKLVHELLLRQCPPAWEFQKNACRASGERLTLRAYTRDKAALTFTKASLLASCGSTLRPETLAGLTGADASRNARIDAALWRIWTFCKGFGHRSLSGEDLAIQVDWLNGGKIARKRQIKTSVGRGNGKGVLVTDLEDLLEIWDNLGSLLSFNRDFAEARATGLFEACAIDSSHTEEWYLEEWIYYIKSLGLPAVVSVSSATSFNEIRESGFTEWTPPMPGQTRSTFFRTAVTSVYQERLLAEAAANATRFALPPRSQHRPSASNASISSLEQLTSAIARHAAQPKGLKINTSPSQVRRKALSPSPVVESFKPNTTWQPETPDTPFPIQSSNARQSDFEASTREEEHEAQRDSFRDSLTSPIRNSVVLQSLGMTPTASTRLGATLFPMDYPPTSPRIPVLSPASSIPVAQSPPCRPAPRHEDLPAVVDPVDKAMKLLTQDMGFSAAEASRALAKCDTGFGIDVQKAIEMLAYESGRTLSASQVPPVKTPEPVSPVKVRAARETCTGHHKRNASDGSAAPFETKQFEPLCDTYPVRQPSILGNLNRNSLRGLTRMTSKAKAYKVMGLEKSISSARTPTVDEERPPRVSSLRAISNDSGRPSSQPLSAGQRGKSKIPPRKAKEANKSKLMGIDEEPSQKGMKLPEVDEVEVKDGGINPAVTTAKAKSTKRFYEGRFGNLGWSDAGSVK
jgi:hypothetical protein